jgi:hypothetical protein
LLLASIVLAFVIIFVVQQVVKAREAANVIYREGIKELITDKSVPYLDEFNPLPVKYPPPRIRIVRGKNKHEPLPDCETPEGPNETAQPPDHYDFLLWEAEWRARLHAASTVAEIDALWNEGRDHGVEPERLNFIMKQTGKWYIRD